jgi:hypothetical protein
VVLAARNWTDLDEVAQCVRRGEDDGAVSESISGLVGDLLANQWDTLSELERAIAQRPEFREFVMRHIDFTIQSDQLEAIERNAETNCPTGSTGLCHEIRSVVEQTMSVRVP